MDKLKDQQSARGKQSTRVKRKPMKVVYISNPVMVKASNSSEFRTLVQELTGQDSDIINSPRAITEITNPKKTTDRIVVDDGFVNTRSSMGFAEDFIFGEMLESLAEFQPTWINV